MRIALAQINTTVGDIQGNAMKAIEAVAAAQAQGAGFILLPELTITGYPPEDLLAKPHFVEANLDALEMVAGACGNATLVGFVDRVGDDLYNAVALCGNQRVLQIYHKRRLPNYGVFDEERYFEPGQAPGLIELGGTMFGITICEDIWVPETIPELVGEMAGAILNISASP
ncbi:MAG: nitrilase-related carbon-nitrogen hydrolase, partial [Actinomycetota bacterium]|nr:nitrilase-related carbon-nitrogen hydrolase [Actinomycetota bacterium]